MGLFGQTPQKTPKEQVCRIFMRDDLKYYQSSGAYRQACNVHFRFQPYLQHVGAIAEYPRPP